MNQEQIYTNTVVNSQNNNKIVVALIVLFILGIVAFGYFILGGKKRVVIKLGPTAINPVSSPRIEILGSTVNDGKTKSRNVTIKLRYNLATTIITPTPTPVSANGSTYTDSKTGCTYTRVPCEKPDCHIDFELVCPTKSKDQLDKEPTTFKVAESLADLQKTYENEFTKENMTVLWTLTEGNGLKTIYVQYKVNNQWGKPEYSQIILSE